MTLYMFGLIIWFNPYLFGSLSHQELVVFFISLIVISAIIPMISTLMLYGLEMIESIEMSKSSDRIGPLIIAGVCYCWLFINFYTNSSIPLTFTRYMLGVLLALFIAFLINLFQKISLHAIGVSGLVTGFTILIMDTGYMYSQIQIAESVYQVNILIILILLILILGITCSARLYLNSHSKEEIMGGILIGCITQILSLLII